MSNPSIATPAGPGRHRPERLDAALPAKQLLAAHGLTLARAANRRANGADTVTLPAISAATTAGGA